MLPLFTACDAAGTITSAAWPVHHQSRPGLGSAVFIRCLAVVSAAGGILF